MTLRLSLASMIDIPEGCGIYAEGSEAGPLISKPGRSSMGFNIICSIKSVLFIHVIKQSNGDFIGGTTFSPARFIRQNKYNQNLYEGQQFQYKTKIFDKGEKPAGILQFLIKYIPGAQYQGEKLGIFQSLPERQPVQALKGLVQSKNVFNFLDPGTKKSSFKVVQSTYRDETWGMKPS